MNRRVQPDMEQALCDAVAMGCKALYIHGGQIDNLYCARDVETLRRWCEHARSLGVPVGCAGHAPEVHRWVDSEAEVDFHAVPIFNCGSIHNSEGERFSLSDIGPAIEFIRLSDKPSIAYKVMGSGRIDARMALEYAFENIKPGDVVNVGMHRGDKDDMVEENAALVRDILCRAPADEHAANV